MIKSWKQAELKELFETGASRRIDTKLHKRAIQRLTALNSARGLPELYGPSFELHKWEGHKTRWSISVNGPWRILFDWINGDAYNVELAQPHG